jgi:hypothetical protein
MKAHFTNAILDPRQTIRNQPGTLEMVRQPTIGRIHAAMVHAAEILSVCCELLLSKQ